MSLKDGTIDTCTVQSIMTHNISEIIRNGIVIPATGNKPIQEHQQSLEQPTDNLSSVSMRNYQKVVFVENLVDTTTRIIDVIWFNFPVRLNTQIIPLRLFIQETLRRSRTSLSTLQAALFYLLRIKPQVTLIWLNPDPVISDSNLSQKNSDPATCGRRMFLASLIVASKYIQDRNYANNAWSKMCGLPVQEINDIERRFLKLIDYNLFISEDMFRHWMNILRSRIQAISGSDLNRPDAFRRAENQQAIAQFEQTLRILQSPNAECQVRG